MKTYCIDIDGTICDKPICRGDCNYETSVANQRELQK